jgi:RNA polymerase sigma-70 factor (ECF subfamily)
MRRELKYQEAMTGFSDEELIRRLKQGETAPLGALFARYDGLVKSALKRFAPRLTAEEVEDLSQEVFIRLLDMAKGYREQTRFKAWLYSIAIGKAKNWRRKNWIRSKLMKGHLQSELDTSIRGPSPLEKLETRQSALRAFALLPRPQQEVLWLFAVEGFSGDEISDILSIGSNTVWTRLYRARQEVLRTLGSRPDREGKQEEVRP